MNTEKAFAEAVAYGLSRVGLGMPGITLKPQQLEGVRHVYDGKDVFLWLPTGISRKREGQSCCEPTPLKRPVECLGWTAVRHTRQTAFVVIVFAQSNSFAGRS